jgi:hypothetical protein
MTSAGVFLGVGSASTPSIGFAADPDTGIYRSGANQVAITGNGAQIANFTGSDVYFPLHNTTGDSANAVLVASGGALRRSTSSREFKKDIAKLTSYDGSLWSDMLHNLEIVSYHSKIETDSDALMLGLIAEQTHVVAQILTSYNEDGTPNGVKYDRMGPLAILELQKNKLEMEDMNNRLLALEALLVP